MSDKKIEVEKNFIVENESGEKTLSLDVFIRTLLQRLMGSTLDYARISEMSDRSLTQFERSVKDACYKTAEDGAKILKEYGYIRVE